MQKSTFDRTIILSSLGGFILICLIFNLTSPESTSPAAIVLVFCLLYLVFYGFILAVLKISLRIKRYLYQNLVVSPSSNLNSSKVYFYVAIMSFLPILFVAMQSIKPVEAYELFLMIGVVFLACLYVYKR